jgi:hypothetical protein
MSLVFLCRQRAVAGALLTATMALSGGGHLRQLNWDWANGSPWNADGGDKDGVGHFYTRNNTGSIIVKMLSATCTTGFAVDYAYRPTQ